MWMNSINHQVLYSPLIVYLQQTPNSQQFPSNSTLILATIRHFVILFIATTPPRIKLNSSSLPDQRSGHLCSSNGLWGKDMAHIWIMGISASLVRHHLHQNMPSKTAGLTGVNTRSWTHLQSSFHFFCSSFGPSPQSKMPDAFLSSHLNQNEKISCEIKKKNASKKTQAFLCLEIFDPQRTIFFICKLTGRVVLHGSLQFIDHLITLPQGFCKSCLQKVCDSTGGQ